MMRIVQVLHGWPAETAGGTGLYVEALARALGELGHTVAIIAPEVAERAEIRAEPPQPHFTAWRLGHRSPVRFEETWRMPELEALWRQWLGTWKPDVVHFHHLSGLSFGMIRDAHLSGARTALTLHDYALPCARGQLVDADLQPCPGPEADRCAGCMGAQLRLNPVNAIAGQALAAFPALRQQIRDRWAQGSAGDTAPAPDRRRMADRLASVAAALRHADEILSPSRDLAERFTTLGFAQPRVFPLPLISPIAPAPDPGTGAVRFLFAGAIIPTKGPQRVLQAFAQLPAGAGTLTIAGPSSPFDGQPDFARELEKSAGRTPGVTWRGEVPHAEMPALLHAHDVLVLPSIWPENSPIIVREATAAGLRVVLSAHGGATELCPDARVVEPDGANDLHSALVAEVRIGRRRQAPTTWPTPIEHGEWLLDRVYPRPIQATTSPNTLH